VLRSTTPTVRKSAGLSGATRGPATRSGIHVRNVSHRTLYPSMGHFATSSVSRLPTDGGQSFVGDNDKKLPSEIRGRLCSMEQRKKRRGRPRTRMSFGVKRCASVRHGSRGRRARFQVGDESRSRTTRPDDNSSMIDCSSSSGRGTSETRSSTSTRSAGSL
jgi:hypothetical protein